MEQILLTREITMKLIKRYESFILFIVKFLFAMLVFQIVSDLNYALPEVEKYLGKFSDFEYHVLMSLLFTLLPLTFGYLLLIITIGLHISAVTEVAIVVILLLLCIMLFYSHLAPKESILVLVMMVAYYFKLPYVVPFVAGMYCSVFSFVPIAIGVFLWHYIPVMNNLLVTTQTAGLDVMAMPDTFSTLLVELIHISTSQYQWMVVAFIFAMVSISVYGISRLSIDFSKEIAIVVGAILNILCFNIAVFVNNLDVSLISVFLLTVLSVLITGVLRFFDGVLDYQKAERVEFEDDDNYYYVKVIPKLVSSKQVSSKQIGIVRTKQEGERHGEFE